MTHPATRAFTWRDIALLNDLSAQGVVFDLVTHLTRGVNPLQSALWAYVVPTARTLSYVCRRDDAPAFGQMRHRLGSDVARLVFLAPMRAESAGWAQVLDHMAREAGVRQAHYLVADVDETSPAFALLRAAGFGVYARQSVWRGPATPGQPASEAPLRPVTANDQLALNLLYADVVPRLVQQVEPPPTARLGWVAEQGGAVTAWLDVRRGPLGVWVEPYFHPEAYDLSAEVLHALVTLVGPTAPPVYVCVRRYQAWLHDGLAQAGFEPMGAQVVMVKRLVTRPSLLARAPRPSVDASASLPLARVEKYRWN